MKSNWIRGLTRGVLKAIDLSPSVVQRPALKNYDPARVGPQQLAWLGDYHPGTSGWTFRQLRDIARLPQLSLPYAVRHGNVVSKCRPSQEDWEPGCRVRLKDPKEKPSPAAQKLAHDILGVIMNAGGRYQMPPSPSGRGNFTHAVGALMWDSLYYDHAGFEILRTFGDRVCGWLPADATMLRLQRPTGIEALEMQRFGSDDFDPFVQIDMLGSPVAYFAREEFCFFIRNATTDVRFIGYGEPEANRASRTASAFYKVWRANDVKLDNGVHGVNLVEMLVDMDPKQAAAFRDQITGAMTGVDNTGRTVFVQLARGRMQGEASEEINIKPLGAGNLDMEFQELFEKNQIAWYREWNMDIAEAGFHASSAAAPSLGAASTDQRVIESERGGWPILDNLAGAFTQGIVEQYRDYSGATGADFMFEFTGRRGDNTDKQIEMAVKQCGGPYMQVNEVRAGFDQQPLTPEQLATLTGTGAPAPQMGASYGAGGTIAIPPRQPPFPALKGKSGAEVFATLNDEGRVKWKDKGGGCKVIVVDVE